MPIITDDLKPEDIVYPREPDEKFGIGFITADVLFDNSPDEQSGKLDQVRMHNVVEAGLKAWTYDAELNRANIDRLDSALVSWIFGRIVKKNTFDEDEVKNSEASSDATTTVEAEDAGPQND